MSPRYVGVDPETSQPVLGFTQEEFARAAAGYGCLECGEDFRGIWTTRCPACGLPTRVFDVVANRGQFVDVR